MLQNSVKRDLFFLVISGVSLVLSFVMQNRLLLDPAWIAIVICGIPIVKTALVNVIIHRNIKAALLVSIALIASIAIGEIFAAGEVAFIMMIGEYLEDYTVRKARAGIEKLVKLTPSTARVIRDGQTQIIPASEVVVGDLVSVFAGESIPVDGIITNGQTSIDQSIMTGEPLPVDKGPNDEVKSGTFNQFGTFDMIAQKVDADSSLQRMIRLVESADAGKAKIAKITDRWATKIVIIALLCAVLTWLFTGELIRAVSILVVFCPCALVLATPTAIMAAIGNLTKHGVLVREGDALERLAHVKRIVFDKTGTLTYGKPAVTHIIGHTMEAYALLTLAASAEVRSEHPLGKALVSDYISKTGQTPPDPEAFQMMAGQGVRAVVAGKEVLAGNLSFLSTHDIVCPSQSMEDTQAMAAEGCTCIFFAHDGDYAGCIAFADTVRPDAASSIAEIHATGMQTLLLTGDALQAAQYTAQRVGISDLHAGCLPADKLSIIQNYDQKNEWVCMVGDGVNDAPALKGAHVGIAMGGIGSDIAVEAADIVLVGDEIHALPHLILLAKHTIRTIHINIIASMMINLVAVGLAAAGILTPVVGALVHNLSSVAVVLNSCLLLTWHKKQ